MTVYAVFKGYERNIGTDRYREDEWLHDIYMYEKGAKGALKDFGGEYHWFEDSTERSISRYYQNSSLFDNGPEMLCPIIGGTREWMRFAPFEVK